jgi:hypothetical protein
MRRTTTLAVYVCVLLAVTLSLSAQTPCVWTTSTTSITETCGNVGLSTATPANRLTVFGAASLSQFKVANTSNEGMFTVASIARDTIALGFDTEIVNNGWVARDESVGMIIKAADRLMFGGSFGNTVGNAAINPAFPFSISLEFGVSSFANAAGASTSIWGNQVTLSGTNTSVAFGGGGAKIIDVGGTTLKSIAPAMTMETTAGAITLMPSTTKVGINTATPITELDVVGRNIMLRHASQSVASIIDAPLSQPASILMRAGGNESAHIVRDANSADLYFATQNVDRLRIGGATGNIGIGGMVPSTERMMLYGAAHTAFGLSNGGTTIGRLAAAVPDWVGMTTNARYNGGWALDDNSKPGWFINFDNRSGQDMMQVHRIAPGTITTTRLMTLTAAGDLTVAGNLAAKYQDVAEWVPSTTELTAGTVVVLNPDKSNEVMKSLASYDTSVAGVVSAQPGLILGEAAANKSMIATTGRVKVRVDATARAIKVGDLLVTSDKPGMAMPSTPVELSGIKLHRPGTIIGKALEPLAGGEGEILVLLSLQ